MAEKHVIPILPSIANPFTYIPQTHCRHITLTKQAALLTTVTIACHIINHALSNEFESRTCVACNDTEVLNTWNFGKKSQNRRHFISSRGWVSQITYLKDVSWKQTSIISKLYWMFV